MTKNPTISETVNSVLSNTCEELKLIDETQRKLEIGFQNLTYTVKTGFFKKESKTLLNGITGSFKPGLLNVILGPSGAGKSTLLHFLSSYKYTGYTGDITVNGKPRILKLFQPNVAFITQDTELQPYLSVNEAMYFAANLKIGKYMNANDKRERIKNVLISIGIYEDRHTRTIQLSGGQKKRLSIAIEVVNDPPVLILDEPTSGLDSSTSNNCIALLKNLALDGRTIICTIHQPSALTLQMFDHIYALANGQCIYSGSTKNLLPFLEHVGLPCPENFSPTDYLMEIATDDYGEQNHKLIARMQNGCNEAYLGKTDTKKGIKKTAGKFLPFSTLRDMTQSSMDNVDGNKTRGSSCKGSTNFVSPVCDHSDIYATPFYKQVFLLVWRTFLIYCRDPSLILMRIIIHTFVAVLIGCIFWNIGPDASNALNSFRYAYYSLMFTMFSAYSAMMVKFPLEVPIIARELFNRWYSLRAYYTGMTLAEIPIQFMCTLIYVVPTYYMTGQPMELYRVMMFFLMIFLTAKVAQSIGMCVGSAMNIQLGSTMGTFVLAPFFTFSGFFLQLKDSPIYMRWMFHISFLKYGLDGVMLAIFGYDRPKLACYEIYCHYSRPKAFLKDIDMQGADYLNAFIFLMVCLVFLRTIAFYVIYLRLQYLRLS